MEITTERRGSFASLARTLGNTGALRTVMAQSLNREGAKARTQVVRVLAPQTGLKISVIRRALRETKANGGSLTYEVKSKGGDIRLKFFKPSETATGVEASPHGEKKVFAHTFMKAGWWPKRVAKASWNGQVFERSGGKFKVVRSGVFIPHEMVDGASKEVWTGSTIAVGDRVMSEVTRRLGL